MILWKYSIDPSKATYKTFSKLLVNIVFYYLVFMQFWIENALSQLAVLIHCTLAISTKTNKFSYFTFKVYFKVIIDQTSLKLLSNQSVVAYNLNAKNSLFIATEFINRGIFLQPISTPYWPYNNFKSTIPQLVKPICLDGILIEPNTLNTVMMWLSSNLDSNTLHATKAKYFWNTTASIRSCPVLSHIISTSWNLPPLISFDNLLKYPHWGLYFGIMWYLICSLKVLLFKSVISSMKNIQICTISVFTTESIVIKFTNLFWNKHVHIDKTYKISGKK